MGVCYESLDMMTSKDMSRQKTVLRNSEFNET